MTRAPSCANDWRFGLDVAAPGANLFRRPGVPVVVKRSVGVVVLCCSAVLGVVLAVVVRAAGVGPGVLTAGPPTTVAASTPTPSPSGGGSGSPSASSSPTSTDSGYIGTEDLVQPADFAAAGWDPAAVDSDVSEGDLQVATTGCQRQTLQSLSQGGQTFSGEWVIEPRYADESIVEMYTATQAKTLAGKVLAWHRTGCEKNVGDDREHVVIGHHHRIDVDGGWVEWFPVTEGRRHYDAAVLLHRDRFGLFSIGSATAGGAARTTEQMNAVARSALSRLSS